MTKDELMKSATKIRCWYEQAINKAFEFNGFFIESKPLEIVLKSNSDKKIIQFIDCLESQIDLLEEK